MCVCVCVIPLCWCVVPFIGVSFDSTLAKRIRVNLTAVTAMGMTSGIDCSSHKDPENPKDDFREDRNNPEKKSIKISKNLQNN